MLISTATKLCAMCASAALLIAVVACQKENTGPTPNTLAALPLTVPDALDNPTSPAKVALGRAVF